MQIPKVEFPDQEEEITQLYDEELAKEENSETATLDELTPPEICGEAYLNRKLVEKFPELLDGETVLLNEGKVIALDITHSTAMLTNPALAPLASKLMQEYRHQLYGLNRTVEYERFTMLKTAGDEQLYYADCKYMEGIAFAMRAQLTFYNLVNNIKEYEHIKEFYEKKTLEEGTKPPFVHVGITGLNGNLGKRVYMNIVDMIDRKELIIGGDLAKNLARNQLDHEPLLDPQIMTERIAVLREFGFEVTKQQVDPATNSPTFSFDYGDMENIPRLIEHIETSLGKKPEIPKPENNDPVLEEEYRQMAAQMVPMYMKNGYKCMPEHFVEGRLPEGVKGAAAFMTFTGVAEIYEKLREVFPPEDEARHKILARIQTEVVEIVAESLVPTKWDPKEVEVGDDGSLKLIYTSGVYRPIENPQIFGKTEAQERIKSGLSYEQIGGVLGLNWGMPQIKGRIQNEIYMYIEKNIPEMPEEQLHEVLQILGGANYKFQTGIYAGDEFIIEEQIRQSSGQTIYTGPDQIKGAGLSVAYRYMDTLKNSRETLAISEEVAQQLNLDKLIIGKSAVHNIKGMTGPQKLFVTR